MAWYDLALFLKAMQSSVLTSTSEVVVALVAPTYECVSHSERRTAPAGRRSNDGPDRRKSTEERILLLGRIRELALYRAEFLRAHGYRVAIPETRDEALRAIRTGNFDVAVLTYTLPSTQVEEFAQLIREYCERCRIIAISDARRLDRAINPDAIVIADDGPAALIAAVRKVTQIQ